VASDVREFEVNPPFRWDLLTPSQLGSLLADTTDPDLWFLDDLVDASGKVLARAGGRQALARAIDGEPALAQPWLRALVHELGRPSSP
jgi:hypothetical protein